LSFAGIGVCGALFSNIVQLALARLFVFGRGTVYVAPPFILVGIISGFTLGGFCAGFSRVSRWYQTVTASCGAARKNAARKNAARKNGLSPARPPRPLKYSTAEKKAALLFFTGAAFSAAILFISDLPVKGAGFFVLFAVSLFTRKKKTTLFFVSTLVFMTGVVFCNVLFPHGKILWTLGNFKLSDGALLEGLRKAFTVESLVLISRLFIKKELRLPGKTGALIGETFTRLSLLNEQKNTLRRSALIESIDTLLFALG
jgi:heptaprenyl diphosphate synthase